MKIARFIAITILTIIVVIVCGALSINVRNFYAHAGILSPVNSTKYALPFLHDMTVSVLNVIVLICIGTSVAIFVDIASRLLYTWEGGTTNPSEYATGKEGSIANSNTNHHQRDKIADNGDKKNTQENKRSKPQPESSEKDK